MAKRTLNLPKPAAAANDCLPHAAMNLGTARGLGWSAAEPVARLVLDEQFGQFVLYRLDAAGGFAGDSWHGSLADALRQVQKEFGIDWKPEGGDG
jgi:hypothetical protein